MRSVVRGAWLEFTEKFEGAVPCWYNDKRGLTTIAYGNLCNTPSDAAQLFMVHMDGRAASVSEKVAAWHRVHDDAQAATKGWRYAATLTDVRLPRSEMLHLAYARLDSNERVLRARLPDHWDDLPACAQMALHSLAWACGANAYYPRLFSDIVKGDFSLAAAEIHMNEWSPEGIHNDGLVPRNVANKILMANAGYILAQALDLDLLDWTHDLSVADAITQPEIAEATPDSDETVIYSMQDRPPQAKG